MKQRKIWIGVGAFVVGASGLGGAQAAAETPSVEAARPEINWRATSTSGAAITVAQRSGEGGEGEGGEGEGGEGEGGEGEGGERAKASGSGEEGGEGEGGEGEGGERAKASGSGEEGGEGEGGERAKASGSGEEGGEGEGGEGEGGEGEAGEGGEGEGGEGGERGSRGMPPDLDFALKLALMRGHLRTGHELVAEKQWDAAFPHFGHPAEELYGDIRGNLRTYDAPPFEAALKNLLDVVKSKDGAEYASAHQAVMKALDAAEAEVEARQSDRPAFAASVAVEMVKVAADEYDEAIVKGRIAKPVEYQDARGFVLEAEAILDGAAPALEQKDAEALKRVRAALGELKQAFPTAMPPKSPVKDYGSVLSDVSRVELAAGPLM